MTADISLRLLPGMGADARMFGPQQLAFPSLQVVGWIPPEPRESIARYAARLCEQLNLSPHTLMGGASFGGVVALEMAALMPLKDCILIGSLRSPAGLRWTYPKLRHLSGLISVAPRCAAGGLWLANPVWSALYRGILRQIAESDARFLKWAVRALLDWQPSPAVANVTIHQIHGQRDLLLPARVSRADHIVPGAGHLLSLTHPQAVNDFIRTQLDAIKVTVTNESTRRP